MLAARKASHPQTIGRGSGNRWSSSSRQRLSGDDIVHAKACERWGIDGFLIINPSWEARYEGLLDGYLTHQNDGTITSLENIRLMREMLDPATLLTVRAHRGLNTPETVLLAGEGGANLTKIDLVYGSLGAGTDPERLTVDGIEAIRLAHATACRSTFRGMMNSAGCPRGRRSPGCSAMWRSAIVWERGRS